MEKPTEEQIHIALEAAERMRIYEIDPHYLACSLRYLYLRNRSLEDLLQLTERYIRFGMEDQHMKSLKLSVAKLREDDERNEVDTKALPSVLL